MKLFLKYRPDIPHNNLILSCHISKDNFDLSKTLLEAINKANRYKIRYLKLIVPVSSYKQLRMFATWQQKSRNPLIINGSGLLGKLSRILWKMNGSVGTYLGLENFKTATEQLTYDEYETFNCDQIDENTLLGGIIGAEQVYESLGLPYYNQKLRRLHSNVVYLPFPVKDIPDFINWLQVLNLSSRFYGFSITMPHKSVLPLYFSVPNTIANLLAVRTDRIDQLPSGKPEMFLNSDVDAFRKALEVLKITKDHHILIYGSGATAQSFFKEFRTYSHLMINARNEKRTGELIRGNNVSFLSPSRFNKHTIDLIVNCSALGMKNEDFFAETGLPLPKKMIDLPYTLSETRAIQHCIDRQIPFIDGKKFWFLQARKQEKIFSNNILHLNQESKLTQ